ncbi:hypothetical protein JCM5353_003742 [Sporobolomyces roseus]
MTTYSTHPIRLGRPSLPPLRSLDIARFLPATPPERVSPPPTSTPNLDLPLISTKSESPISCATDEEDEEEVIVIAPKRSSRVGMKLNSVACKPCKKQHTVCSHQRPCPRCCNKGIEHLCIDAPSRRGKKPLPVDADGTPLKRPPLHRLPSRSTSTRRQLSPLTRPTSIVTPQPRSLSKALSSAPNAPPAPLPHSVAVDVNGMLLTSPSISPSSPSAQHSISSCSSVSPPSVNTPLSALRLRPITLSSRYYESSESDHSTSSGDISSPSS